MLAVTVWGEVFGQPLPADFYYWPGPRSYTGQDVVELHTLACPPLVDLVVALPLTVAIRGAFYLEAGLRRRVRRSRSSSAI